MIPQEKSAAVTRGLREAFGVTECEDIRMMKDLASSQVFRIVVRGNPFLLKISLRTSDPARHYTCMKAAAEAGLAPRVRYASVEDRLSIEDFVGVVPLPATEALVRVPTALRKLHALPPFPGVPDHINTSCMFLLNPGPARDGFVQKFQAANPLPDGKCEQLLSWHAQVAASYPRRDEDMVSSHNDLFKPDNILFDGQRIWLVDWEAAFRNDRYADVAVVANMLVTNDTEEAEYLGEYFGQPPDEYQRARFYVMRQVAHMFYTMGFLFLGSLGQPVDWSGAVPEYWGFQRRIWAGEVNLSDKATKVTYGKVHWVKLEKNMREGRFGEALRIVAS